MIARLDLVCFGLGLYVCFYVCHKQCGDFGAGYKLVIQTEVGGFDSFCSKLTRREHSYYTKPSTLIIDKKGRASKEFSSFAASAEQEK